MASWTRVETVTRAIEWRVPVWADHGAPVGEIYKAISAAARMAEALGQTADSDDWCTVVPGDEYVAVRLVVTSVDHDEAREG